MSRFGLVALVSQIPSHVRSLGRWTDTMHRWPQKRVMVEPHTHTEHCAVRRRVDPLGFITPLHPRKSSATITLRFVCEKLANRESIHSQYQSLVTSFIFVITRKMTLQGELNRCCFLFAPLANPRFSKEKCALQPHRAMLQRISCENERSEISLLRMICDPSSLPVRSYTTLTRSSQSFSNPPKTWSCRLSARSTLSRLTLGS